MGGKKQGKKKQKSGKGRQGRAKRDEEVEDTEMRRQQLDEWTAISAIFQEDCDLLSEQPFIEYSITILPHSSVGDSKEDVNVAVDLIVRYVSGYPHRPPKLRVVPKKGLVEAEVIQLQEMLTAQAAAIAREGRVMVFNLAEAAQEFLSEHISSESSLWDQMQGRLESQSKSNEFADTEEASSEGGPSESSAWEDAVDVSLFSDWWGESDNQWGNSIQGGANYHPPLVSSPSVKTKNASGGGRANLFGIRGEKKAELGPAEAALGHEKGRNGAEKRFGKNLMPEDEKKTEETLGKAGKTRGRKSIQSSDEKEDGGEEEEEEEDEDKFLSDEESEDEEDEEEDEETFDPLTAGSSVSELLQTVRARLYNVGKAVRQTVLGDFPTNENSRGSQSSSFRDDPDSNVSASSASLASSLSSRHDSVTQTIQKDLMLGHLLRLVTSSKGPLPHSLPALASQLQSIGVMPAWTADLLAHEPQLVDKAFRRMFQKMARESETVPEPSTRWAVKMFWEASPKLQGEDGGGNAAVSSRYLADFEEISLLGRGGFGHVVLCVNKLDGRKYAVKKIKLKGKSPLLNSKILREVATLSRLQHHNIVRYYQAWFETGVGKVVESVDSYSKDLGSAADWLSESRSSTLHSETKQGSAGQATFLYIQMEYCPRTLRQVFESRSPSPAGAALMWRMFRQIAEGLAHIHAQGVIHRDLNPNNIFFDAKGDIKIGDFGLAKFTSLEVAEEDSSAAPAPGEGEMAPGQAYLGSLSTTGQVGTYFYTAPEIEQAWPHTDEKVDMYSLGVVLFELFHPFDTAMERALALNDLKKFRKLPELWAAENPQVSSLVTLLVGPTPGERPTAREVLRSELLPPRMEDEALEGILRTLQNGEDASVLERVMAAVFESSDHSHQLQQQGAMDVTAVRLVGPRDRVLQSVCGVFVRHGAVAMECRGIDFLDESDARSRRGSVKVATDAGHILALRSEARLPLARWIAATQTNSLKRYEISQVYRKAVGRTAPLEYFQGDFDMIGGSQTLADAETIKVATEVVGEFLHLEVCEIRLSHRELLDAIWSWAGIGREERGKVAQLLAVMAGSPPRSTSRKAAWPLVRTQLMQGIQLPKTVVDRLQSVESRFSGEADEALARLRGALPKSVVTSSALDELSTLLGYLRVWGIGGGKVTIDALMAPSEDYLSGLFFQVHVRRIGSSTGATSANLPPACIAVGGRYDVLLQRLWPPNSLSSPPGAVGVSIGVQKLIMLEAGESKTESPADVLVCSRGGGGLLKERMQMVAELWTGGIKAEFVCSPAPSLTEQYEYAHEHGIKQLVIINEAELSATASVKVRRLDVKNEEEVPRTELVKYFSDTSFTVNARRRMTK